MVFRFIVSTRCLELTIICIRVMDRILNFRNRCRFALKGVHELSGWAIMLAPIVFMYGFVTEPKYWQKHCEYMQKKLDYNKK